MTKLLKNAQVVSVFTGELEKANVLIDNDRIAGFGDYDEADEVYDYEGKYICPGFLDGHIHIESSMLTPKEYAKAAILHGMSGVIADPHEIANVCGEAGIEYMIESFKDLPMDCFVALPSCVPAMPIDESGAVLTSKELAPFYENKKVIALGEVMNYPGVISRDKDLMTKIGDAIEKRRRVNGHAPMVTGRDLDKYIYGGITDEHECPTFEEALEALRKSQWIMIREGTAAKNLSALIDLFDDKYYHRCMLVTDDKHPADLKNIGQLDDVIRKAVKLGKSAIRGIQLATICPATYFDLRRRGAIAPGYKANILVLNDLDTVDVNDVFYNGRLVVKNKEVVDNSDSKVDNTVLKKVLNSMHIADLKPTDFIMEPKEAYKHVIGVLEGTLISDDIYSDIHFEKNNGIDIERDFLKVAVCERHHNTGHIGLGFIHGIGLRSGAIASTISHDSHNLIIIGTNEEDMAFAANEVKKMGGGNIVVENGKILARMPLKIAGLMSTEKLDDVVKQNSEIRAAAHMLGAPDNIEPFMHTAFMSLTVIPHISITTRGLYNVDKQELF